MSSRVALLAAPWTAPFAPSLALATLGPVLERAGFEVECIQGILLFEGALDKADEASTFNELFGAHLFAAALYPDRDDDHVVMAILRHHLRAQNLDGLRQPQLQLEDLGQGAADLVHRLRLDIRRARSCVSKCVAAVLDAEPCVLGLSCTFESQLPAALAVARRVKVVRPNLPVILGGAAAYGPAARALMEAFPSLDAVCHTEGEQVIVPLVTALRAGADPGHVPGVVYRRGSTLIETPSPPLLQDLDSLPTPNYGFYFRQGGRRDARLYFETSRGCWWGRKHLCTFCGLNTDSVAYRKKSADRVEREIRTLSDLYPDAVAFHAADNILDMGFVRDLLPRLEPWARQTRQRLFFETKSNLRRDQIERLVAAGITHVQPGIESFQDDILRRMKKGANGLQQVQFIKWASEYGLKLDYNVLVRNPGEQQDECHEMAALIPYLEALPPPESVTPVQLQRFSPYHTAPGRYGIRDVRPSDYYAELWDDSVDTTRLAYQFEFVHDDHQNAELVAAQRQLVVALDRWRYPSADERRHAAYVVGELGLGVVERQGSQRRDELLTGVSAAVFSSIDRVRGRAGLASDHPSVDPDCLDAALAHWRHRRWAVLDRHDRWLGVIVRARRSRENLNPERAGQRESGGLQRADTEAAPQASE